MSMVSDARLATILTSLNTQITNVQNAEVNANNITAGVLSTAVIPALTSVSIIGTLNTTQIPAITSNQIQGLIGTSQIPSLTSNQITGLISTSQLPAITSNQLTGSLTTNQVPALTSNQILGTLNTSQIPVLTSAQYVGTISTNQLPALTSNQIIGTLSTSQVPALIGTPAATGLAVKGTNNYPHINSAKALIRQLITNQGAGALDSHRQALEQALPSLMASTAWSKIRELYVPLGSTLAAAMVKIKPALIQNTNFSGNVAPVIVNVTITGGTTLTINTYTQGNSSEVIVGSLIYGLSATVNILSVTTPGVTYTLSAAVTNGTFTSVSFFGNVIYAPSTIVGLVVGQQVSAMGFPQPNLTITSLAGGNVQLSGFPTSFPAYGVVYCEAIGYVNSTVTQLGSWAGTEYTAATGITGDGTSKGLISTGVNAQSIGLTPNNWGFAIHTTSNTWTNNGVLGGFQNNSAASNTYFYLGGQLPACDNYGTNALIRGNNPGATFVQAGGWTITIGNGCTNRMNYVQASTTTGHTTSGVGSLVMANVANAGTYQGLYDFAFLCQNVQGTPGNFSNATLTGYAIFDALTTSELDILSRFFDQMCLLTNRPVFENLISIGDSITAGKGSINPFVTRWTSVLARMLNLVEANANVTYGNYGIGSCSLQNLGLNNNFLNYTPATSSNTSSTGLFFNQFQHSGAIYTIAIGINDLILIASPSVSTFLTIYSNMLTQLQAAGINMGTVILCSLTYADPTSVNTITGYSYYTTNISLSPSINTGIQALAIQFGCVYVDLWDLWNASTWSTYLTSSNGWTGGDGLHPNNLGHQLIATTIYNVYTAVPKQTVLNNVIL